MGDRREVFRRWRRAAIAQRQGRDSIAGGHYRRKGGVEKRTALVDCTVNQYGRVAIAEANRLGVIAVRAVNSVDPSPPVKPSKPNQWNECIERAGAKALWLAASAKRYSDMRQDGRVPEN